MMHSEPIIAEQATPEFDFSHLIKTDAVAVAAYLRRHRKASDEMYLEALRQLDPPLELSNVALRELYRELSPPRRGRPRKGAPRLVDLAEALLTISRDDVPSPFLCGLARRLRSGKRYTRLQRLTPLYWDMRKRERMMHLRGLYRDFYALLENAGAQVYHPILGHLPVPESGSRHEKALKLAQDAMRNAGLYPPSLGRMRNITGKNSRAKT